MSSLSIFCDESGTMPVDDAEGVFCVAVLTTQTSAIRIEERSGHIEDIGVKLKELECLPQVVFVKPRDGYSNLLRSKMSKMNTMARASRLVTGSHEYLPGSAHNSRNLIWIRCMALCVVRAVIRRAELSPINSVRVILDEKTLPQPSRRMFEDRVRCLRDDILGPNADAASEGRSDSAVVRNIRFARDQVSITWSSPDTDDGLYLAHRLSGLAKTAIEKSTQSDCARVLGMEQGNLFYDSTSDVIRPVSKRSVERWKLRTGLPEPLE
jgi:hypothetical protein